ncbi:hypothetical protein L208DRAFT_1489138 [Tricholoma matsutake]|nr:hypothetical protein L208DRAFT_1489138 [Tricholoma matsutake 945]
MRAVGLVSVNGGEVHIIPQWDEQGQLTSSGYAFHESLYPGFVDELQSDSPPPASNIVDHGALDATPGAHPCPIHRLAHILGQISLDDNEEASLVNEFDVDGADAGEVLGYEGDGDDDNDGGGGDDGDGDGEGHQPGDGEPSDDDNEDAEDEDHANQCEDFITFQKHIRVTAAKRAEGNRRAGGLKMQRAMVKAWDVHQ